MVGDVGAWPQSNRMAEDRPISGQHVLEDLPLAKLSWVTDLANQSARKPQQR